MFSHFLFSDKIWESIQGRLLLTAPRGVPPRSLRSGCPPRVTAHLDHLLGSPGCWRRTHTPPWPTPGKGPGAQDPTQWKTGWVSELDSRWVESRQLDYESRGARWAVSNKCVKEPNTQKRESRAETTCTARMTQNFLRLTNNINPQI